MLKAFAGHSGQKAVKHFQVLAEILGILSLERAICCTQNVPKRGWIEWVIIEWPLIYAQCLVTHGLLVEHLLTTTWLSCTDPVLKQSRVV